MTDLFGNEEIRKLSFWQPFGTLMFYGKVETRSWNTKYRGLILICTTQKTFEKQPTKSKSKIHPYYEAIKTVTITEYNQPHNTMILNGYAIGIGRLSRTSFLHWNDMTFFDNTGMVGLYSHYYTDVKRIVPFQIKGVQGYPVKIDDETKSKIKLLC